MSHDDIRRIASGLPETHERASYGGRPSFRTTQRMFAWIQEDPEALVVRVESQDEKEAPTASRPAVFVATEHDDGQPSCSSDSTPWTSPKPPSRSRTRGGCGARRTSSTGSTPTT